VRALPVVLAVVNRETSQVSESPAAGDLRDGGGCAATGEKVLVGVVQADAAKVIRRGALEVLAEHVLQTQPPMADTGAGRRQRI
jgi:hypothetical protein